MVYFLALSLLSGALELGSLFYALEIQAPVPLLFPLVYQLGNLLFLPSLVTPRRARRLCMPGLALAILGGQSPALFLPALLIASLCVQAARAEQKSACPTWLKRTFRIGGFLFSPLTAVLPGLILVCCLLMAWAALAQGREGPHSSQGTALLPTMVFHQMHYFVYAYMMPAWILRKVGIIPAAVAFALTWVVYLIPQVVAEKTGHASYRAMFFACHSFLLLVMAVMCAAAILDQPWALAVLWVLTGLGGGSVFCIRELTPGCRSTDLTLSENVGHVLGCLAAVCLSCVIPDRLIIPALTGCSCIFVGLTLLSARKTVKREVCRDG